MMSTVCMRPSAKRSAAKLEAGPDPHYGRLSAHGAGQRRLHAPALIALAAAGAPGDDDGPWRCAARTR